METYEQKYNIALDWARKVYPHTCGKEKEDLERVFPDLKESEDERIRKLLVWQVHRNIEDETNDLAQSVYDGIKGHDPDLEESIEDWKKCLAWLEKQKEQKPYQEVLSDSENRMLDYHASLVRREERKPFAHENDFVSKSKGYIENAAHNYAMNFGDKESELYIEIFDAYKAGAYYAELRQKPAEWSEEDEDKLKKVIATVQCAGNRVNNNATNIGLINWLQNRLKSLRPQPHWKPSEEQMSSLWQASIYYKSGKIKITGKTLESLYNDLQKL